MCLWYTLGQHLTWSRNFGRHQYGHMLIWGQVGGVYHQLLIGCIWPLITTLMCAILIQLWSNVFVIYLGTTSDLKQELWKASIWSFDAHLRASGWCIPPTTDWIDVGLISYERILSVGVLYLDYWPKCPSTKWLSLNPCHIWEITSWIYMGFLLGFQVRP